MKPEDFDVTGQWSSNEGGHTYEATAKTKKTGRVIARASGNVSLDRGHDMVNYFGTENARGLVEESIRDICHRLATNFPE